MKKKVVKRSDKDHSNAKVMEDTPKLKIDKRFSAMFVEKDFKLKYVTDERGYPVDHTSSSQGLKELYASAVISEPESSTDDEDETKKERYENNKTEHNSSLLIEKDTSLQKFERGKSVQKETALEKCQDDDDDGEDIKSDSDSNSSSDVDEDYRNNLDQNADDIIATSDSSSDTSSDTDEDNKIYPDDKFDHNWMEWDAETHSEATEITKRLALCNMDWDRIRAEDILAVFNSFKPANGIIHSVKIYPSEFGLKRMEEENLKGPKELVEEPLDSDTEEVKEDKEGSKYHREKLRQYQINRLKYYYAVIECDSPNTADFLYTKLNGMEYESSAVCMDLRFIPDDTTFDQEPKWVALSVPDPTEYKPRLFVNSALQQVKVNLTWDETDPKRRETIRKAFKADESIEKDLENYLASPSSSSASEDEDSLCNNVNGESIKMKMEDRIARYRALIQSVEDNEKDNEQKYDMEITWEPEFKEKTEEIVKDKIEKKTLTPFEEKLKKKKEERKLKKKERKMLLNKGGEDSDDSEYEYISGDVISKESVYKSNKLKQSAEENSRKAEELALLLSDPEENQDNDLNPTSKRKKRKNKIKRSRENDLQDIEENIADSRFSAMYTSHLYNIDPSDRHYEDDEEVKIVVREKLKKRKKVVMDPPSNESDPKKYRKTFENDDLDIGNSIRLI